jgi:hypothetical protein
MKKKIAGKTPLLIRLGPEAWVAVRFRPGAGAHAGRARRPGRGPAKRRAIAESEG